MNRAQSIRFKKLCVAWGGVAKLSDVLGVHRSTLYRYMGGELDVPKHFKLSCNVFAEHVGVPPPFDDAPPLDDEIRKFIFKHNARRSA